MSFVGRGEKLAERILNFNYPGCYVLTQVPIKYLMDKYAPHYSEILGPDEQRKTIDLFVVSGEFNKDDIKMVVRVQDTKTHTGTFKSKLDAVQKDTLQGMGLTVVDLIEMECEYLFKNKPGWKSTWEVVREIEKIHR